MERPIKDLPEWAQLLYAEYLRQEMANEGTMFQCSTLPDTHKAFDMVMRAYVAGYRDRTKQLRPVPQLRDFPVKPDGTTKRNGKGPPPLPTNSPFNKGR
jgi:hypothetical protein